jgi:hypothetical protein
MPSIDPNLLNAYTSIYNAGGLPLEALLYAAKHGELPEEFEPEQAAAEAMAAEAVRLEEQRAIDEENRKLAEAEAAARGEPLPDAQPTNEEPPADA